MSLDELWEIFPITLSEHNPQWYLWADEEMAALNDILAEVNPCISHIGSTAIGGIKSKPIIDLLIEIDETVGFAKVKRTMTEAGYICMSESERRISFNKGYTPSGYADRVFHLHVVRSGDEDEIAFRDYLRAHPDAAREYERLKINLLARNGKDRDGYTAAKTKFVERIVRLARAEV